ncbi:MAG: ABC transporter permease [Melioribacteraceae bacterium]|nr:ABC transporter permease [Melioribacteraceae bacterium]MCF8355588.1 ABC transporter permease [Melioribacteraceae bacterium]MCF8395033.1 ABC transporter permease [Melioribacteraceae bacterium]MCF8420487.1 ABC transporter permease [Melioribacteraceae bacterium]
MLENYIKIAWKVLLRRKFFTFVSLFGISFTIFVLLVATSILDHAVDPGRPQINQSRILVADRFMATDSARNSVWMSSPGFMLLNRYAKTLKTPELVSIHSGSNTYFTYMEGNKLNFTYKFTDDTFWQIYKFNFIKGKPFGKKDYNEAQHVAVITEYAARKYFYQTDVIGKFIEVDGTDYRVIGVVENVSKISSLIFSDIWVPATTSKDDIDNEFMGSFRLSVLAYSPDDFNEIRNEWHKHLRASVADLPENMVRLTTLKCVLKSNEEMIAELLIEPQENFDSKTTDQEQVVETAGISNYQLFYLVIAGVMLLFMLLPSINLVNINLSRMIERNSEIGVRKAFGATQKILVGQFITENIILTFIGGVISLIAAGITLSIINNSGIIMHAHLSLNFTVFIFGFITCVVLGFVSGVYPAFRMSKLHPVEALRGGSK